MNDPTLTADASTSCADESAIALESTHVSRGWHQPGGLGALISLSLPLMMSAGFVSLTLFTDRALLYITSDASASAALGAGSLYWMISCLPMGTLGYISTFVSQYRGAKQPQRIGVAYQHAMLLAWFIVPVFLLLIVIAPYFFTWSGHKSSLAQLESSYLRILLVGGIALLFYNVQSGLMTGQGRTAVVLAIDGFSALLNLGLCILLIFGWGVIPPLGIFGAGLATAISFWIKLPIAYWLIRRNPQLQHEYKVSQRMAWESDMFIRILKFGTPAGLQMLAESACFVLIIMQVGLLGEQAMAATTLALGLNVLAFVPMIGLGIGVGVLVGKHLTEGRADLARRTVFNAILLSTIYTGVFACLLGFFPLWTASVYAIGSEPERFQAIQHLLIPLLRIIALYCIFDGLQIVFVGAIKGSGDTTFVLLATFVVSTTSVLIGMIFQATLGPTLLLWWWVIFGWVVGMAVVFFARFQQGKWQTKRVIETLGD